MMNAEDQVRVKERPVTTTNYSEITSSVRNEHEALIIAEVTSYPHEIVDRCGVLLFEVMYKYFFQKDNFARLKCCLDQGGKTIMAELSSIHEQLMLAETMLEECQNYIDTFRKEDSDNDKRART